MEGSVTASGQKHRHNASDTSPTTEISMKHGQMSPTAFPTTPNKVTSRGGTPEPSLASLSDKHSKRDAYKAQKRTYRSQKKEAAKELLSTITDPAVVLLGDWLKVRGTLKSWTKLWCVLKPGLFILYKSDKHKGSQWVGTVLLNTCQLLERPSKKDGFCFKLFHPLDQSVWATKGPKGETIGAFVQPLPYSYCIFRAPSESAGKCWMDALELALKCTSLLRRSMTRLDSASDTIVDYPSRRSHPQSGVAGPGGGGGEEEACGPNSSGNDHGDDAFAQSFNSMRAHEGSMDESDLERHFANQEACENVVKRHGGRGGSSPTHSNRSCKDPLLCPNCKTSSGDLVHVSDGRKSPGIPQKRSRKSYPPSEGSASKIPVKSDQPDSKKKTSNSESSLKPQRIRSWSKSDVSKEYGLQSSVTKGSDGEKYPSYLFHMGSPSADIENSSSIGESPDLKSRSKRIGWKNSLGNTETGEKSPVLNELMDLLQAAYQEHSSPHKARSCDSPRSPGTQTVDSLAMFQEPRSRSVSMPSSAATSPNAHAVTFASEQTPGQAKKEEKESGVEATPAAVMNSEGSGAISHFTPINQHQPVKSPQPLRSDEACGRYSGVAEQLGTISSITNRLPGRLSPVSNNHQYFPSDQHQGLVKLPGTRSPSITNRYPGRGSPIPGARSPVSYGHQPVRPVDSQSAQQDKLPRTRSYSASNFTGPNGAFDKPTSVKNFEKMLQNRRSHLKKVDKPKTRDGEEDSGARQSSLQSGEFVVGSRPAKSASPSAGSSYSVNDAECRELMSSASVTKRNPPYSGSIGLSEADVSRTKSIRSSIVEGSQQDLQGKEGGKVHQKILKFSPPVTPRPNQSHTHCSCLKGGLKQWFSAQHAYTLDRGTQTGEQGIHDYSLRVRPGSGENKKTVQLSSVLKKRDIPHSPPVPILQDMLCTLADSESDSQSVYTTASTESQPSHSASGETGTGLSSRSGTDAGGTSTGTRRTAESASTESGESSSSSSGSEEETDSHSKSSRQSRGKGASKKKKKVSQREAEAVSPSNQTSQSDTTCSVSQLSTVSRQVSSVDVGLSGSQTSTDYNDSAKESSGSSPCRTMVKKATRSSKAPRHSAFSWNSSFSNSSRLHQKKEHLSRKGSKVSVHKRKYGSDEESHSHKSVHKRKHGSRERSHSKKSADKHGSDEESHSKTSSHKKKTHSGESHSKKMKSKSKEGEGEGKKKKKKSKKKKKEGAEGDTTDTSGSGGHGKKKGKKKKTKDMSAILLSEDKADTGESGDEGGKKKKKKKKEHGEGEEGKKEEDQSGTDGEEGGKKKKKKKKKKKEHGEGEEGNKEGDQSEEGGKKKKKKKKKKEHGEGEEGNKEGDQSEEGGKKKKKDHEGDEGEKAEAGEEHKKKHHHHHHHKKEGEEGGDPTESEGEHGKKKKKKKKKKEGEAEGEGEASGPEDEKGEKKKKKKKKKHKEHTEAEGGEEKKPEEGQEVKSESTNQASVEEGGKKKKKKKKSKEETPEALAEGGEKKTEGEEKKTPEGEKEQSFHEKDKAGLEGHTGLEAGAAEASGLMASPMIVPSSSAASVAVSPQLSVSGAAFREGAPSVEKMPSALSVKGMGSSAGLASPVKTLSTEQLPGKAPSMEKMTDIQAKKAASAEHVSPEAAATSHDVLKVHGYVEETSPSGTTASSMASSPTPHTDHFTSTSENDDIVFELPFFLQNVEAWRNEHETKVDHFRSVSEMSQLCPKCVEALKEQGLTDKLFGSEEYSKEGASSGKARPGSCHGLDEDKSEQEDTESTQSEFEEDVRPRSEVLHPPEETSYCINKQEELGQRGDECQTEEVNDENKGLIWMLVKQVRPGMDLSKVVLPTFILEPRSFLDKLSDYYYHADILSGAVLEESPYSRMKSVVKWYLSGFYKKPKGLKKPYNPVIGEVFRCCWQHPATGSRTFYIAEQVSHHPPVSVFHVTNRKDGFNISGSILARSKFYGNSLSAFLDGVATLSFLERGEDYFITMPYAHCKGILIGTLTMELGGKVTIDCPKTGYKCELDFKLKPFLGSGQASNRIHGKILMGSDLLASIDGHWDQNIYIKDRALDKKKEVFWDPTPEVRARRLKRCTVPLTDQCPYESERLWGGVSKAVVTSDMQAATNEKYVVEEEQRKNSRDRKLNKTEWVPRYFEKDYLSGGDWIYRHADDRPWDGVNDVYQYEKHFVVQTQTRHKTPHLRANSINSVNKSGDKKKKLHLPLCMEESDSSGHGLHRESDSSDYRVSRGCGGNKPVKMTQESMTQLLQPLLRSQQETSWALRSVQQHMARLDRQMSSAAAETQGPSIVATSWLMLAAVLLLQVFLQWMLR